MSITGRDYTANQAAFDKDISKLFIFDNQYKEGTFINGSGAEVVLVGGEIIARNPATLNLVILDSTASDGREIPVGINATCGTVADGVTKNINICVSGDVAEGLLELGTDTLDTVIGTRTLGDRLAGDTKGIQVVEGTELTNFDN